MQSLKKISIITLSSAFILSIILFSCSKESINSESSGAKPGISELIEKKTGLSELKNEKEINLINKYSDVNSGSVYYKSSSDNKLIVVTNINNQFVLNKGVIANGEFIIENRFELIDNMDDEGNGSLTIKNINENVVIMQTYSNGIFNNQVISSNGDTHRKLCQREAGETFSQCNSRETNEFCDDFVSTVAYITNPSIPILIAALCSC